MQPVHQCLILDRPHSGHQPAQMTYGPSLSPKQIFEYSPSGVMKGIKPFQHTTDQRQKVQKGIM